MKLHTRYDGVCKQNIKMGMVPAIITGLVTGALTYFGYRYANAKGFRAGYIIGTPDYKDVEEILTMSVNGMSPSDIAKEMR